MVTSVVTKQPAGVALVRMSRYASWYAQNAMAQAMQVQAVNLPKPYLQNLKKPETQDAANPTKPYILSPAPRLQVMVLFVVHAGRRVGHFLFCWYFCWYF